jgi:hypothetical protein
MRLSIPSNKKPFSLDILVKTGRQQKIRVSAFNKDKPKTYYLYHKGLVNGQRTFSLLVPKSANTTIIDIYNIRNGNFKGKEDKSFTASFKLKGLKTCPIWMSPETTEFVKFAQFFAENASILTSGDKVPHIYSSDNGKFFINYYNKIRDRKTGNFVSTPARVGHLSGKLDVAKKDFLSYTIPARMIVLLHEYSHKYMNPKISRPISYETGADISALMLYLSMGYSPIEAHQAFLYVFKDANNKQNFKRYLIIRDFIKKFAKGEVNNCQITSKQVVQT